MALKLLSLLLIFPLIVSTGYAETNIHSHTNSSPFEFIKTLEGCGKGNNTQGINHLKAYLKRFGYIQHISQDQVHNDDFDDILESAVKTYQENYNLNPTGILDAATVSLMSTPRCGVPDIVNGVNLMQRRRTAAAAHGPNSCRIHAVSRYGFVINGAKWEPKNRRLTYKFLGNFPKEAKLPIAKAFKRWAAVTRFTFAEVKGNEKSDLTLAFGARDHGDGAPFDGQGGTLAHAFYPTDGRLHFDLDEPWSFRLRSKNSFDLSTVALHEIGHLLGLTHSTDVSAIMYSLIKPGEIKLLGKDDIEGIRTLYKL